MVEYLPPCFRPSSLRERRDFYARRFRADAAWRWVQEFFPRPIFAVKIWGKTNIYDPRFQRLRGRNVRAIYISSVHSPRDLRKMLTFYAPEGAYYWRTRVYDYGRCKVCPKKKARKYLECFSCENFWGQELVFDVDPENFCQGRFHDFASFTMECFYRAREAALNIFDTMRENYSDVRAVFSGRGFHIHVLDEDAWFLPPEDRTELAKRFEGIDPWVTRGGAPLIRLPYSLNGVVNKEVIPLTRKQLEGFDPCHHSSSSSMSSP